jgi:hypothetical protein
MAVFGWIHLWRRYDESFLPYRNFGTERVHSGNHSGTTTARRGVAASTNMQICQAKNKLRQEGESGKIARKDVRVQSIPPEDWHLYTLLLLRLSRTQLLLNNVKDRNKADIISSVANGARLRLHNRLRLQDTAEPQNGRLCCVCIR